MAAAPRTNARTSDKPAPVSLNLDTLERENGPAHPFVVGMAGKRITFADPQELAWEDVLELDNPQEFLRLCLSEEDREFFLKAKITVRQLRAVMQGFKEHYGIGSLGEDGA